LPAGDWARMGWPASYLIDVSPYVCADQRIAHQSLLWPATEGHPQLGRFRRNPVHGAMPGYISYDHGPSFWKRHDHIQFLLIGFNHTKENHAARQFRPVVKAAAGSVTLAASYVQRLSEHLSFYASDTTRLLQTSPKQSADPLCFRGALPKIRSDPGAHFGCPAMEAPTPVSRLSAISATMVKAGVLSVNAFTHRRHADLSITSHFGGRTATLAPLLCARLIKDARLYHGSSLGVAPCHASEPANHSHTGAVTPAAHSLSKRAVYGRRAVDQSGTRM